MTYCAPRRAIHAVTYTLSAPKACAFGSFWRQVTGLDDEQQQAFTDRALSWAALVAVMDSYAAYPDYEGNAYGLSKACINSYTMMLARDNPTIAINACTPGFIATDLTRGMGATLPPEQGTRATLHCLFGDVGSGFYYGSDAQRSPLNRYRGPGSAPYEGP